MGEFEGEGVRTGGAGFESGEVVRREVERAGDFERVVGEEFDFLAGFFGVLELLTDVAVAKEAVLFEEEETKVDFEFTDEVRGTEADDDAVEDHREEVPSQGVGP